MKTFFSRATALMVLLILLSSRPALACSVCFGDTTGSKMGNAATWGIVAMTIIMFAMLGTLVGFGFYLAHRAKHPLPDYEELLRETEGQPKPETSH